MRFICQFNSSDGNLREQATLAGLRPSTTYSIRMLAVNEIEHSPFTDPIIIKTREEAPIESPQNLQAQSGEMGEIIVTWQVIINVHIFQYNRKILP